MRRIREPLYHEWVEYNILPRNVKYKGKEYKSYYIPYQRGCYVYEGRYSNWRTWIPKYYPHMLKKNISDIGIVCPLCSSPMVNRGGFYGCSSYPRCRFMIPKLYVYEALSDGYAKNEIYRGPLPTLIDSRIKAGG